MFIPQNSKYSRINMNTYAVIPVWYGCNSSCTICMLANVKGRMSAVDFDTFSRLVTILVNERRYDNLILSGAEITTFEHIEQYVRYAASFRWFKKIQIQTNGRKLAEIEYVKKLVGSGVNEFFVSVHGLENIHDAITRVSGSYAATMEGIGNLAEFPVNVISNTVLTRTNFSSLVSLFTKLSLSAVNEMHLWNFFPMATADDRDLLVSLSELLSLLPEIKSVISLSGKPLVLKGFPACLSPGAPCYVDSAFPLNLIQDDFWSEFSKNGFGACIFRDSCSARECWGLSRAYMEKYGDERRLISPYAANSTAGVSI